MHKKTQLAPWTVAFFLALIASFSGCKTSKIEGQDYVNFSVLLRAPDTSEAVPDSRDFFVSLNSASVPLKTYTLEETSKIFQGDSHKLVSFNAREFLRYANRKLIVNLTVAESTDDGKGGKREDFIQQLETKVAHKDLFGVEYKLGEFDLNSPLINRNRPTLLVLTLTVQDPFYNRFINSFEGRTKNLRGVLISVKKYFTLSTVMAMDYPKPLEYKTAWGKLYTFQIEDKSRFFDPPPAVIQKFDTSAANWGNRTTFTPASDKTPRFIIASGGAGPDLIYTYPPLIVYSGDFPENDTNAKQTMDAFFNTVAKGLF